MQELLNYQADRIERTLAAQGLGIHVVGGTMGSRLIVFHAVKPASVKLSAVMRMEEEIALGLGVSTCRIARNGHYLTIEIPRRDSDTVHLLDLIDRAPKRPGAVVVGVDEEDTPLLLPLDSPNIGHVLIAGTTGSGKTALARAMIAGLTLRHPVYELSLGLIDPKRRGYGPFVGLPHLVHPVIHEPEEAAGVLAWAVEELERRDRCGAAVRGSRGTAVQKGGGAEETCPTSTQVPRLVIFIDELSDLMQTAGERVEASLTRLVQRGREAGIHVVACTQKPTAAVIGSLVKANFPARIVGRVTDTNDAYVASGISGTGAERLLGRGDFLVVAGGDVTRMQGAYISDSEIRDLVTRLRGGRPASSEAGSSARGKVLDFVERYRERWRPRADPSSDSATVGGRGGHNRKPPTEEMIAFALAELVEHGEVSQAAVRNFHKRHYGTDCNPRRAKAAIQRAAERLNAKRGSMLG